MALAGLAAWQVNTIYRWTVQYQQYRIKAMEKHGRITRVDTPTEWSSNLMAVWKADKAQVRVCLDP